MKDEYMVIDMKFAQQCPYCGSKLAQRFYWSAGLPQVNRYCVACGYDDSSIEATISYTTESKARRR